MLGIKSRPGCKSLGKTPIQSLEQWVDPGDGAKKLQTLVFVSFQKPEHRRYRGIIPCDVLVPKQDRTNSSSLRGSLLPIAGAASGGQVFPP